MHKCVARWWGRYGDDGLESQTLGEARWFIIVCEVESKFAVTARKASGCRVALGSHWNCRGLRRCEWSRMAG